MIKSLIYLFIFVADGGRAVCGPPNAAATKTIASQPKTRKPKTEYPKNPQNLFSKIASMSRSNAFFAPNKKYWILPSLQILAKFT